MKFICRSLFQSSYVLLELRKQKCSKCRMVFIPSRKEHITDPEIQS